MPGLYSQLFGPPYAKAVRQEMARLGMNPNGPPVALTHYAGDEPQILVFDPYPDSDATAAWIDAGKRSWPGQSFTVKYWGVNGPIAGVVMHA